MFTKYVDNVSFFFLFLVKRVVYSSSCELHFDNIFFNNFLDILPIVFDIPFEVFQNLRVINVKKNKTLKYHQYKTLMVPHSTI